MKQYIELPKTNYIFLPDGSVAVKLKPTRRKNRIKYNVFIDKKFTRFDREEILQMFAGVERSQPQK